MNSVLKTSPEYSADDLIPLSYLGRMPFVLVTSTKFNLKSIEEFKKLNNSTPVTFAITGTNSASDMTTNSFKNKINKNIISVPYKGSSQSLVDVVSGQLDAGFFYYSLVLPMIEAGKINAVAVEWPHRLDKLPTVPTLSESGIKDLGYNNWWMLFSNRSKNTSKLNQIKLAMSTVLESPTVKSKFRDVGLETINQTVPLENFIEVETKNLLKNISKQ
jgi:tripartite-type tricarboxylate transporter receptor subunit TctC